MEARFAQPHTFSDFKRTQALPTRPATLGKQLKDAKENPDIDNDVSRWLELFRIQTEWAQLKSKDLTAWNEEDTNTHTLTAQPFVGLLDPFLVDVRLIPKDGTPSWRMRTQFSNSARGYIVEVKAGASGTTGTIRPEVRRTENEGVPLVSEEQNKPKGSNDDYIYSSTHNKEAGTIYAQESAELDAPEAAHKPNKGDLAGAFDALTVLAAEGARFKPIAALGADATPQSVFWTRPSKDNWDGAKGMTFYELYTTWSKPNSPDEFRSKYGIPSVAVRTVVLAQGKPLSSQPPGTSFCLDDGGRVVRPVPAAGPEATSSPGFLERLGPAIPIITVLGVLAFFLSKRR